MKKIAKKRQKQHQLNSRVANRQGEDVKQNHHSLGTGTTGAARDTPLKKAHQQAASRPLTQPLATQTCAARPRAAAGCRATISTGRTALVRHGKKENKPGRHPTRDINSPLPFCSESASQRPNVDYRNACWLAWFPQGGAVSGILPASYSPPCVFHSTFVFCLAGICSLLCMRLQLQLDLDTHTPAID